MKKSDLDALFARFGAPKDLRQAFADEMDRRQKAEERLVASESKLRAIVEGAIDSIFIKARDGRYLLMNPAGAWCLQRTMAEVVGMRDVDFFHPDEAAEIRRIDELVMETGQPHSYANSELFEDGLRHFLTTKIPYRDEDGQVIGIIGFGRDITDYNKLETRKKHVLAETAAADAAADEARRRAEELAGCVTELSGNIAHTFNNLLTVIIGNAELEILRRKDDGSTAQLEPIKRSAEIAAGVCAQLLAYSGKAQFLVKPQDLTGVVTRQSKKLREMIPENVALGFTLGSGLPPIMADETPMGILITNLVANAVEAIGKAEGRIEIITATRPVVPADLEQAVGGPWSAEGSLVTLTVTDTGRGIDPEVGDRVFDPFYSTGFTGRGLGLAAVLGIVRGHQGAIRIDSKVDVGSSFEIMFPAAP